MRRLRSTWVDNIKFYDAINLLNLFIETKVNYFLRFKED